MKQLMIYMLYLREAGYEMDKTKFVTKMLVNISKTLRGKGRAKKNSKRNLTTP